MDGSGNAFAVWQQYDGTRDNVHFNHYFAGTWGIAEVLEIDNQGDATVPNIALNTTGSAVAGWLQEDGLASSYARVYE